MLAVAAHEVDDSWLADWLAGACAYLTVMIAGSGWVQA